MAASNSPRRKKAADSKANQADPLSSLFLSLANSKISRMAQPLGISSARDAVSFHTTVEHPRFEAPNTLLRHGISCAVWGEDALWHYGVRTVYFDLFLLVEDLEAAAQCLEHAGYSRAMANSRYKFIPELHVLPRFTKGKLNPDEGDAATYVALLRAQQCSYSLPLANISQELIPPLPALVDSIIDAWLDATATDYGMHLTTHLSYLHDYCSKARDPLFIAQLKPEHRDFYRRSVSPRHYGRKREMEKCTRFLSYRNLDTARSLKKIKSPKIQRISFQRSATDHDT
jgi:hypothetical protein